MKASVLDAIAIDLADVEIGPHVRNKGRRNMVGGTPNSKGRDMVL